MIIAHGRGVVSTGPVTDAAVAALAELEGRGLNFEPLSFERAAADPSWRVDHVGCELPPEPPGPPVDGGSFQIARQALIDYEFADPHRVRAVYDVDRDLEGRNMLIEGRFLWMRFQMGVRVVGVVDGPATLEGALVHRFGFGYRTLAGHLERGHMDYELLKWPDTGRVDFRIHAYSQRAHIESPLVRLGFAIFARSVQRGFYDRSLRRMHDLVAARTDLANEGP